MTFIDSLLSFFERLVNIQSKTQSSFDGFIARSEKKLERMINRLRKKLMVAVIESLFIVLGIVFLFVGIILYFSRFFQLETILIISGILSLYIFLLIKISR